MTQPGTPPTVAVSGTAQREVPPDSWVLNSNVEARGASSAAAHESLAARFAELEVAVAALPDGAVEVQRGPVSGWREAGAATSSGSRAAAFR